MPKFGSRSKHRLRTAHPLLQKLCERVVETYDCTVLEGHRGERKQMRYYTMRPQRSKTPWPQSKHNSFPSNAVDLAPYDAGAPGGVDWENTKVFYHFAGYVQRCAEELGIPLRWGGDWDQDYDLDDQKFMDLVHFELGEQEGTEQ